MARHKPTKGQITIFEFLSLFVPKKKSNAAPRASLADYGLTKQRCRELSAIIRSGEYTPLAYTAARRTSETLAPWIIKSVMKKRSYDRLEYDRELGRIPCGRTDFYGYQRKFFYYFDLEIRK